MADQRLTDKGAISSIDDADLIHIVDVSDTSGNAAGTSKKGLWSAVKSTLKTYFDTLYGTVTSVAVSGSDGIEVDSGSPITTSGTIALGVNKAALLSHLGLSDTYVLGLAFGDETSDITTGVAKLTFQMPNFATTLTGVSVNVKTAPTGSVATFDLNENGTSVLSTKITIDAGETTSETAATPPVISDSSIAANAIMTVDIDGVGSTVAGVAPKLWIYYTRA